jgi:hypothetical protein
MREDDDSELPVEGELPSSECATACLAAAEPRSCTQAGVNPDVVIAVERTRHFDRGAEIPLVDSASITWHGSLGLHAVEGSQDAIAVRRLKRSEVAPYLEGKICVGEAAVASTFGASAEHEAAGATLQQPQDRLKEALDQHRAKELVGKLLSDAVPAGAGEAPRDELENMSPLSFPESEKLAAGSIWAPVSAPFAAPMGLDPAPQPAPAPPLGPLLAKAIQRWASSERDRIAHVFSEIRVLRWASLVRMLLRRRRRHSQSERAWWEEPPSGALRFASV